MPNIDLYHENLSEGDQLFVERIEAEAEKTPPKDSGLAVHVRAILKLRAKGYSYRDIAEWFRERGIKANHVDVWRAHKNSLPLEERVEMAEHDDTWQEFVTKKKQGQTVEYAEKDFATEDGIESAKVGQPVPELGKLSKQPVQRKIHKDEHRLHGKGK